MSDCKKFPVPGKDYLIEYTCTIGTSDIGRVQQVVLSATRHYVDLNGKAVIEGTWGAWAMTLTAPSGDVLQVTATSQGNGILTGQ